MRRKLIKIMPLSILLTFIVVEIGNAQVLPFNTNTAISIGFEEKAIRPFVKVVQMSKMLKESEEIDDPLQREVTVVATPVAIPYAVSRKLIPMLVVPTLSKQMTLIENGTEKEITNSGLSDITLMAKYVLFQRDKLNVTRRAALFGGVKFPTGSTAAVNETGNLLPPGLQLGSGSWDIPLGIAFIHSAGGIGIIADLFYQINTKGNNIDHGDSLSYGLAIGYRLYPSKYVTFKEKVLNAYLELNGSWNSKSVVKDKTDENSGGISLFLSPGLQWIFLENLLAEASLQLPIYQRLNGTQLGNSFSVAAGLRYLLPF